jgi:hypothetical protein
MQFVASNCVQKELKNMSQPLISKADLKRVINELREADTKPTYLNIRQALGNRGSFETIHKFKREIVDEELAAKDSPEFLKFVRAGWVVAVQEGRDQREDEINDHVVSAAELAEEAKKFQSEALANKILAADVADKLEDAIARLHESNDALSNARAASEGYAVKLVEVGERHQRELGALREEAAKVNEHYRVEITRLREQAEKASEHHRGEITRLGEQLAHERDRAHDLDVRLARAEAIIEMMEKAPGPTAAPVSSQPEDNKG